MPEIKVDVSNEARWASEAISHAAGMAAESLRIIAAEYKAELTRPSVLYRPVLSMTGTGYRMLYGDPQTGCVGYGDSPEEAARSCAKLRCELVFSRTWCVLEGCT
jgi:hypothetical protein